MFVNKKSKFEYRSCGIIYVTGYEGAKGKLPKKIS